MGPWTGPPYRTLCSAQCTVLILGSTVLKPSQLYLKPPTERSLVYMNPLAYGNVGPWCVRKIVLVTEIQKTINLKTPGNNLKKFHPMEVHF